MESHSKPSWQVVLPELSSMDIDMPVPLRIHRGERECRAWSPGIVQVDGLAMGEWATGQGRVGHGSVSRAGDGARRWWLV